MPDIKLAKLPDRTPVKISITVSPDLHAALRDYAEAYRAAYGTGESVAELVPYMLSAFINGDIFFKKARRKRQQAMISNARAKRQPPGRVPPASTTSSLDRS